MRQFSIILFFLVCALNLGAQTLTATYISYADSADRYIKEKRWDDAERNIIAALRHEPANKSNYLLWSNLGTVRTERGDYEGALQAFEIGLSSAPKSTVILGNRARTQLAFGHTDLALGDLDAVLAIDSIARWPLKMRGIMRGTKGDVKGAEEDFRRYRSHYGADASIAEVEAGFAAGRGDTGEAMRLYDEALRLEPDEETTANKFITAWRLGILENKEEELRKAIGKYPRNGNLILLRGAFHKMRYENAEAERDRRLAGEYGADPQIIELIFPEKREKRP